MADTSEDSGGAEWYEEPVTIVGFVAGFLLLVLVVASILILCHSKDEEEEEEEGGGEARPAGPQVNGRSEHTRTEAVQESWPDDVYDRTNPLYVNANEFALQPFPQSLRAKFVHIHIDEKVVPRDAGFMAYYNT